MGNENGKRNEWEANIQREIQLLQWRSQAEHNTNIPRTIFLDNPFESLAQCPGHNTAHFIQGTYVDLNQYYKPQGVSCNPKRSLRFVVFQEYIGNLANMVNSLTIEENLYTLNTLLSGYEKIYRKFGYAFLHEKCCFITKTGELRAWINMDPLRSYPDHHLIREEEANNLAKNRSSTKAMLSTEASICKAIVKMNLCFSDGNKQYLAFYHSLRVFMAKNILQNLSFRSIRTFVNAYIYENRIIAAKNLYRALQRYHQTEVQKRSDKTYTFQVQKSTLSNKSPLLEDLNRSFIVNSKTSLRKSSFTSQQRQNILPQNNQFTSSNLGKQSNISSKASQKKHIKSNSTNFCTPTHHHDKSTHYLAASTQYLNSRLQLRQQNTRKMFQGLEKTQKDQKYFKKVKFNQMGQNQNPINKSMFLKQQQPIKNKKNLKFHSRQQSEVGYFDETQNLQKIVKDISNIPSYKFNHTKDLSSNFYSQKNHLESSSSSENQSSFRRRQSRTLTRFVSGLLENDELLVCESQGSFQSIKMKEDVPYSGVLLQMGRSVEAINDPPLKSKCSHRAVVSGFPNSTF